ncbi:major facilitator superfamily domain-containing protein [Bombardia bombarda]|uniref:Major facilitator superfamily domain-containing protein n=1 Tax=Bombardia bombarda TaxID=252184 RepID=A0AA39TTY1_9PEZI|nr:major facilitator superfamily domain-containing protein [Bombardia bombarda]
MASSSASHDGEAVEEPKVHPRDAPLDSNKVSSSDNNAVTSGSEADVEKQPPAAAPAFDPAAGWDGPGDPENPRNFSTLKKMGISIVVSILVWVATFDSSVLSPASRSLVSEFGISREVSILSTSLFVLGFAFGPVFFGPASEALGRKKPLAFGMFMFAIFIIPVAVAKNAATIFVCRFLGGSLAAGGILADLYDPITRGIAVAAFALATFLGPVLGPIIGGFLTMNAPGWRWTQWLALIVAFTIALVFTVLVPETSAPILLARRAEKRRKLDPNTTNNIPEKKPLDFKRMVNVYVLKPWIMLVLEPILALMTIYLSFVYGFLYLCFVAFPISFQQERGWNLGVGALPFIAVTVGVFFGVAVIIWHTKTRMVRIMAEKGEVSPEERMIPMMLGSVSMPIGMFWFAWTSNPNISWVPQVISGSFIGFGILLIFLQVCLRVFYAATS